ncbi:MAG: hypothetical protein KGD64_06465 [Candidatus Heimdallarchaeota archaeon]|nr:hypothetical protein [Candidatus Heimdallarchaeota archaeon]
MSDKLETSKENKTKYKIDDLKRFMETRKMFLIVLVFSQLWVSVLSFITTQFVYINTLDCEAATILARVIPVAFFLVHALNAAFIIYLYEKKHINNKLAFFLPLTNLIVSGIVFALLYVIPMCS